MGKTIKCINTRSGPLICTYSGKFENISNYYALARMGSNRSEQEEVDFISGKGYNKIIAFIEDLLKEKRREDRIRAEK